VKRRLNSLCVSLAFIHGYTWNKNVGSLSWWRPLCHLWRTSGSRISNMTNKQKHANNNCSTCINLWRWVVKPNKLLTQYHSMTLLTVELFTLTVHYSGLTHSTPSVMTNLSQSETELYPRLSWHVQSIIDWGLGGLPRLGGLSQWLVKLDSLTDLSEWLL